MSEIHYGICNICDSSCGLEIKHAGVSINDVTDEALYDGLSGASVLDGIPVKVTA